MAEWIFPVTLEWYNTIVDGLKVIEGRVSDPSRPKKDYSKLKKGDIIVFMAVDDLYKEIQELPGVKFRVRYNKNYSGIEEMLQEEGLNKVLPGVKSIEDGVRVYHSFPGYKERIKKYGINAIGLEKI